MRSLRLWTAFTLFLASVLLAGAQEPGGIVKFSFTPIACGDVLSSEASSINDSSSIIGTCQSGTSFYQVNGINQTIGVPNSSFTIATAVNNNGDIVGYYQDKTTHLQHGFLLSGTVFTQIDPPTGTFTELVGINDSGLIIGYTEINFLDIAFAVQNGVFSQIEIAGSMYGFTRVNGINNHGDLVGTYTASDRTVHGFLLQSGVVTNIDVPIQGAVTSPTAINNAGIIVGNYGVGADSYGFEYVNGVYFSFKLQGPVTFSGVTSINDLGEIVGTYYASPDGKGRLHGYMAQLPLPQ